MEKQKLLQTTQRHPSKLMVYPLTPCSWSETHTGCLKMGYSMAHFVFFFPFSNCQLGDIRTIFRHTVPSWLHILLIIYPHCISLIVPLRSLFSISSPKTASQQTSFYPNRYSIRSPVYPHHISLLMIPLSPSRSQIPICIAACTAQSTAPGMFHPFGGCTDCGRFPQGIGMALERGPGHKKMRHPKYHGEI